VVCQKAIVLGHRSGHITTHYSAAELANLIEVANRVWESSARKKPTLAMLKQKRLLRSQQALDAAVKVWRAGRIRTHDAIVICHQVARLANNQEHQTMRTM